MSQSADQIDPNESYDVDADSETLPLLNYECEEQLTGLDPVLILARHDVRERIRADVGKEAKHQCTETLILRVMVAGPLRDQLREQLGEEVIERLTPLQINDIILPEQVSEIGKGGMGRVLWIRLINKRKMCLKLIADAPANTNKLHPRITLRAAREAHYAQTHQQDKLMRGAGMLRIPDGQEVPRTSNSSGYLGLFLEYIQGTELEDYIAKNLERKVYDERERQALRIGVELIKAAIQMYEEGKIHRDIKPRNAILMENGSVKLTDFGLVKAEEDRGGFIIEGVEEGIICMPKLPVEEDTESVVREREKLSDSEWIMSSQLSVAGNTVGTMLYLSPESFLGEYDHQSELWSIWVSILYMLSGRNPYEMEHNRLSLNQYRSILAMHRKGSKHFIDNWLKKLWCREDDMPFYKNPILRRVARMAMPFRESTGSRTNVSGKNGFRYSETKSLLETIQAYRGDELATDAEPCTLEEVCILLDLETLLFALQHHEQKMALEQYMQSRHSDLHLGIDECTIPLSHAEKGASGEGRDKLERGLRERYEQLVDEFSGLRSFEDIELLIELDDIISKIGLLKREE